MGKKKKPRQEGSNKPPQGSLKDIDDIFAEKLPQKVAEQKMLTGNSHEPTGKTAGDDLATVQKKITTAKLREPNLNATVVADDDFSDIRGTKKRSSLRCEVKMQANGLRMA